MKRSLVLFSLILLSILSFRFYFFYNNQPQFADGQGISFEMTILSQPQVVGSRQVLTANHKNHKIRITTSRFPELNYGQDVRIAGALNIRMLNNKNVIYSMYFPKIEIVKDKSIFGKSLGVINNLRQNLISFFSRTLPSPSSSLLMGIVFGIKEQMPKNFADNLRTAGVLHVIAASGMNVTLIGGFISSLFAFFLNRRIALGISVLGIMFYAVLAGLEASIIRASIMGMLVFSAQIMGRQTLAVNGLLLAGFAMLFISPSLISDIGFQLSFTATLGILYIKRVPATIAAQLATLPILLANFGTYSLYSVLVNGLVLWTVPILMVIGAGGAVIGLILEPVGQLIIYFAYPLLIYFESVVNFFGKVGGVVSIQNLAWQFSLGYYFLLSSAVIFLGKKTK